MISGAYGPARQPLHLLARLQQEAPFWDPDGDLLAVPQPYEQARKAGFPVHRQKVQVVVEAGKHGAHLEKEQTVW